MIKIPKLLLGISICFSIALPAKADEVYSFLHFICKSKSNYFQADAVNLWNKFDGDADARAQAPIYEKQDLYYGDISKSCQIGKNIYTIKLYYDPPRDQGVCGGDEAGHLTISKNNQVIIDDIDFNADCSNINVNKIVYYDQSEKITLCGVTPTNDPMALYVPFCVNFFNVQQTIESKQIEQKIKQSRINSRK